LIHKASDHRSRKSYVPGEERAAASPAEKTAAGALSRIKLETFTQAENIAYSDKDQYCLDRACKGSRILELPCKSALTCV